MAKHIGIVSVNYEGTALCYRSICAGAASAMGEYQHPQITIHSFPLADYMRFVSRLDWEGVAGLLLGSAERVAWRRRLSKRPSAGPRAGAGFTFG